MKRVSDSFGVVHFKGNGDATLCGTHDSVKDLFGVEIAKRSMRPTHDPVTCPDCARLYCEVKNAPWNEVEANILERATFDAVIEDGCGN